MADKLDLHGRKHEDARGIVIRFIEDHWRSNKIITVITGNSSEMKEITIDVIKEYGLQYIIGDFLGFNRGQIKINME